ncbi:MAG: citrate transporter [Clostridia bacterium]|nr:citrate transporter [Clostridia bacterium]
MSKLKYFLKNNIVMLIAAAAMVVTVFFVPPDAGYLGYFDFKTLACLFMTLGVVCALRNIKFFSIIARKTVKAAGNLRFLALLLVVMTFIGSMIIANDMALITFLPIGYYALSVAGKEKHSAYIFILQNISANLGGMLTPFGNPQNLYLYSKFGIPTGEFTLIMLPPFLLAIALLAVCCFILKPEKIEITGEYPEKLNAKRTALYLALFALSVLCIFRVIDWRICIVAVTAALVFADRSALRSVDYPLLLTFVFFFVFTGNLARIPAVQELMSSMLSRGVLLPALGSCQLISNVPTAILLSRFTDNYRELLLGVNIGGTGTLIASLASLITFSEFRILYPGQTKKYLGLFFAVNFIFLAVLGAFAFLITR